MLLAKIQTHTHTHTRAHFILEYLNKAKIRAELWEKTQKGKQKAK